MAATILITLLIQVDVREPIIARILKYFPVQCAALKLSEDCVKFLLKHGGANPWVISSKGQTLIHLAAFSTFVQLMEIRERVSWASHISIRLVVFPTQEKWYFSSGYQTYFQRERLQSCIGEQSREGLP